jgi:hypothetical protein
MNAIKKAFHLMVCALLILVAVPAQAQTALNASTGVNLSFQTVTTYTINCTTPPAMTVSGNVATSQAIVCTSTWNLPAGYGVGACIAEYFSSATPFGIQGPTTGAITANVNSGGAVAFGSATSLAGNISTACGSALPSVGAQYFGPALLSSATEGLQVTRTDSVVIAANLTGVPANLSLSGTLNFVLGLQ